MTMLRILALTVFVALTGPAYGQTREAQVFRSLEFKSGTIDIGEGLAKFQTGKNLVYLNPTDAERFLTEVWANPKGVGQNTLGIILPRDVGALSPEAWAIVVTFDQTGYISDKDAGSIDYEGLLKDMQAETREANEERKRRGWPAVELVGWARQPVYNAERHTLYWAKRLHFADSDGDTLNYNLRVLGRRGVLVLNVVAGIEALGQVEGQVEPVLARFDLNDGHRYDQFDAHLDDVAAYGLAGLIAGGVLAKTGFFKGLLLALLASKKLLFGAGAAAIAGGWATFRRFLSRSR
jgi:uncharacterized membrane-anchored protein